METSRVPSFIKQGQVANGSIFPGAKELFLVEIRSFCQHEVPMNRPLALLTCILFPIAILLLGIAGSVIAAIQTLPDALSDDIRGVIPPKLVTRLEIPTRYSVWFYSSGKFEGQLYESFERVPAGVKIRVIDSKSGDFIPLNNWMSGSKSTTSESAFLVGSFETVRKDQEVQILASGLERETVIGISSRSLADIFRAFLLVAAIFMVSLIAAIGTLIAMLLRRKKQLLGTDEKGQPGIGLA